MVGEVVANEYGIVFESKDLDFLRKFEVPPEFGIVREAPTSFEASIAEGCAVWVAANKVSDRCKHGVSYIVHEYCMKEC